MKLTDAKIKALKPEPARYEVWEANGKGFGLRVSSSGRKTFVFMYRFNGTARRMTLGTYPSIGLSKAHELHAKARQKLERGTDPGQEQVESNKNERDSSTIAGLAGEYIEKRSKKKKAWKEEERILKKDVVPKWRNRKAKDIKRRDVILILDKIAERGAPIMANRTLGVLKRMFNFGIGRDILENNPCSVVERPGEESQRDRVLSAIEIKKFWVGIDECQMKEGTKLALKFLLVCLQRKSEVTQAEWTEFDLNTGWWSIPKTKTKNGLAHRVFLPSTAKILLKEIKELSEDSPYLFPSPRGGGSKSITSRSLSQALLKNREILKIEPFVPHDLRRTGASQMASIGIPRFTIGKILNHIESGVTAVYDRHSYNKEKTNAMSKWDRTLKKIISGESGKIIELNRK